MSQWNLPPAEVRRHVTKPHLSPDSFECCHYPNIVSVCPLCIQAEVDRLDSPVVLSEPKSTQMLGRFMMLCAKCGQPLRDGVKFCEKCGARVQEGAPGPAARTEKESLCGNCGCSVTTDSKTCKWCGAELKQADRQRRARPPLTPDGHGSIQE